MPLDGKYDFSGGKYDKQSKDTKDRRLKDGPNIDELIMVGHGTHESQLHYMFWGGYSSHSAAVLMTECFALVNTSQY